jgi:hypothetical protein
MWSGRLAGSSSCGSCSNSAVSIASADIGEHLPRDPLEVAQVVEVYAPPEVLLVVARELLRVCVRIEQLIDETCELVGAAAGRRRDL